ncbi:MAG: ABC transporter permease subunit [Thermosynechococcaceae cyanobacterium]
MITVLANIDAIFRKELQGYFKSPLSYVIAGFFWILTALFFVLVSQNIIEQAAQSDLGRQMGQGSPNPIDVPTVILQNFLSVMGSILLFVLPILSMNLYTEERKRGTLELLATSPISNWVVACGKLLGVLVFTLTLIVPIALLELFLFSAAKPAINLQVFLVGHLGLLLLAASVLSLGMFISSLSDSAIVAAILTFVLIMVLWVLDFLGQKLGSPGGDVLNQLSLLKHFTSLSQGVLDSSSVVLFLSYVVLGLFLTAQSIDLIRFQQS